MANDFHVVLFVNQTKDIPYGINVIIPPDDLSAHIPPPDRDEGGKFNLEMLQPTDQTRHLALGMFMDAWSKLEIAISNLLQTLLNTSDKSMPALMNSLGSRGQLEVISVLGQSALPASKASTLAEIVENIRTNTTRRNYIVHGYWMLEILIRDHGGRPVLLYRQYRAYNPSDPEVRTRIRERQNRRDRSKYLFSIPRINSLTREVGKIMGRVQNFTVSLRKSKEAEEYAED